MDANSCTGTGMRKMKLLSALMMSCFVMNLSAEELGSCHYGYEDLFLPEQKNAQSDASGEIDVKADSVQLLETGTSIFSGNVDINRNGQQLSSQRATYNKNNGTVTANGDVRLRDSEMVVDAERAEWSTSSDEGKMLDAEYKIRQAHARGESSHLYRKGQARTYMKNATYTTCPMGSNAWNLKAGDVYLNHETAIGEAEDVVLRIGGLPVFYTPYINFPLNDERKSGFLVPSIGSSGDTGFDVMTPYYWNIAPNMDATLTPRYMADRGLMLGGQFRYLFESSEGEIEASYLNSDDQKDQGSDPNPYYQQDRTLFSWQNDTRFNSNWRANVDYNYVSDSNYFEDFGGSLNLSSRTHLNRLAQTTYSADFWQFTARVQGYQTLGDVDEQYKRLPQFVFSADLPDQALGLSYELDAEYVEFDHNDKVDGQRINFEPAVSLPLGNSAFFFTPRVALSHTQYNLSNDNTNTYDDSASRTVPISSIDTGMFFDRQMHLFGGNYTQTLEPRAFYLYIPRREQSDIPVFDTAESTFNMIQLFSYDRFTGSDRIGDANQLSLAVTSRIIDEQTGKENMRLTLGQIQYFSDREVTMPGRVADNSSDSDLVAEALAYIADNWSVSGEVQWNPSDSQTSMSSVALRYRGDNGGIFNISHRYRKESAVTNGLDGLEQVDISALWPVSDHWKLFGRWYHSLEQGRTLESLGGVEYDSCCWATRLAVRDYVNNVSDDQRNLAIFLQIELKGLGSFGKKSDSLLERSIRGFEND